MNWNGHPIGPFDHMLQSWVILLVDRRELGAPIGLLGTVGPKGFRRAHAIQNAHFFKNRVECVKWLRMQRTLGFVDRRWLCVPVNLRDPAVTLTAARPFPVR